MSLPSYLEKELKGISRLAEKIKSQSLPSYQASDSEEIILEQSINKLISKSSSLKNIPKQLSKIEELKNYQSYHIIVHEKGTLFTESYSFTKPETLRNKKVKVKDFNLLFSTIIKSKSQLFHAKNLKTASFPLVGYFLSTALKTQRNNILIVVTGNSFLSPLDHEIDDFQKISPYIAPIIDRFYIEKKSIQKQNMLIEFVENSPLPIAIKDKENNHLIGKQQIDKHISHKVPFTEGFIEVYGNTQDDSSDFFHDERLQLLGELLNTLRHELSNPLFGLKLASNILVNYTNDQESLEFIKHIETSSSRCENIIENFTKFYQNHSHMVECDIESIVEETLTLTKSETKQLSLTYENKTQIKHIQANPTWIIQILFNFIINSAQSVQHRSDGSIKVIIKVEDGKLCISVVDNGRGVDNSLKEKILEPFFTTKSEGTGIGLSISNHLAKKMNGEIHFSNNQDNNEKFEGATFSLLLPLKQ